MEGIGQQNAEELLAKVREEVNPPIFAKIAGVSKPGKE